MFGASAYPRCTMPVRQFAQRDVDRTLLTIDELELQQRMDGRALAAWRREPRSLEAESNS